MAYYFQKEDDTCYTLEYHLDHMRFNEISEMEVFKAVPEYGTGNFFCKVHHEAGDSGDSCGKICDTYAPRNGKSGRCKNHGSVYSHGKSRILKINNN